MDDSKTVTLTLAADQSVDAWLMRARPTLIIRCQERTTALYVVTETAATPELGKYNEYSVTHRVDQTTAVNEDWTASTDSRALFSPEPIVLARRLRTASIFRFRFTPFNASPAIATFSVSGLAAHLPKVAAACGWPIIPPPPKPEPVDHATLLGRHIGVEVLIPGSGIGRLVSVGDAIFTVDIGAWRTFELSRIEKITIEPGGARLTINMK